MTTQAIQRTVIGEVVKTGREKTITVSVSWSRPHPRYGKVVRQKTKYQVHDPESLGVVGAKVEIASCAPVSKTKSWKLLRIVEGN